MEEESVYVDMGAKLTESFQNELRIAKDFDELLSKAEQSKKMFLEVSRYEYQLNELVSQEEELTREVSIESVLVKADLKIVEEEAARLRKKVDRLTNMSVEVQVQAVECQIKLEEHYVSKSAHRTIDEGPLHRLEPHFDRVGCVLDNDDEDDAKLRLKMQTASTRLNAISESVQKLQAEAELRMLEEKEVLIDLRTEVFKHHAAALDSDRNCRVQIAEFHEQLDRLRRDGEKQLGPLRAKIARVTSLVQQGRRELKGFDEENEYEVMAPQLTPEEPVYERCTGASATDTSGHDVPKDRTPTDRELPAGEPCPTSDPCADSVLWGGFLDKLSCVGRMTFGRKWSKRWVVFDQLTGTLCYYHHRRQQKSDAIISRFRRRPKPSMKLIRSQDIVEVYVDRTRDKSKKSRRPAFVVRTKEKKLFLKAETSQTVDKWVTVISSGIKSTVL